MDSIDGGVGSALDGKPRRGGDARRDVRSSGSRARALGRERRRRGVTTRRSGATCAWWTRTTSIN